MNTLISPVRLLQIEPKFSPKPAKRTIPVGEDPSDSPSKEPETPSPSNALQHKLQPIARGEAKNGTGYPAQIKDGIVSFS